MGKVVRFPSRVTGAMRLPDPLDYPNEGDLRPCDCEPRDSATVIVLPAPRARRITPAELWLGFIVFASAFWFAWAR